jgi:hypothetical protein
VRGHSTARGTRAEAVPAGGIRRCKTSSARHLPLPLGRSSGFETFENRHLVKWVLLTPAIFPRIDSHPGGWLPSWVDATTAAVQLLDCPGKNAAKRHNRPEGKPIPATLVAALNWHGDSPGTEIRNRCSTLMGEKGFGLGVCGSWSFHNAPKP